MGLLSLQNAMNGHIAAFVPSIENDLGQDMFLTTDAWSLMKHGRAADVPLMTGLVADEGSVFAQGMYCFYHRKSRRITIRYSFNSLCRAAGPYRDDEHRTRIVPA